jgi:hypothetical protein
MTVVSSRMVHAPLSANDEATLREWCRDGVLGARLGKLSMAQAIVDLLATVDRLRAENACAICTERIAEIDSLKRERDSALDAMDAETLRAVLAEQRCCHHCNHCGHAEADHTEADMRAARNESSERA